MRRASSLLLVTVLAVACSSKPNTAHDILLPGGKTPDAQTPPPTVPATPHAREEVAPDDAAGKKPEEAKPEGKDAAAKGALYLLRDTGKRCITSPCPSWAAVDVGTRRETEITGVDVSAVGGDDATRRRVLAGQVWVRGEIRKVPKQGPAGAGTVLFVVELVELDEAAPDEK